jgi:hypothetical protein
MLKTKMKKIISVLTAILFPVISFAQNYNYRMMDGYNYAWGSASHSGFGVGFLFLIPLIWVAFMIAVFTFWIMMLIDAIKHTPEKTKLIWVLVIIFTHIIGALVYYFVEKKPRMKHGHKE